MSNSQKKLDSQQISLSVCQTSFALTIFKTLSDRQAKSRKSKASNAPLRLRLKPKTILKLFPNLSRYLSSASSSSYLKKFTSSFQLSAENCNIEELNWACLAKERVDTFDALIKS